jgi:hypothetical protein
LDELGESNQLTDIHQPSVLVYAFLIAAQPMTGGNWM